MQKTDCVFCQIAHDLSIEDGRVILDSDEYYVTLALNPQTVGHSLVIPKEHYSSLSEIPESLQGLLFQKTVEMAEIIQNSLGAKAYIIKVNNDLFRLEEGKGHIGHIHFHIIPRYNMNERSIEQPPAASKQELADLCARIKKNI